MQWLWVEDGHYYHVPGKWKQLMGGKINRTDGLFLGLSYKVIVQKISSIQSFPCASIHLFKRMFVVWRPAPGEGAVLNNLSLPCGSNLVPQGGNLLWLVEMKQISLRRGALSVWLLGSTPWLLRTHFGKRLCTTLKHLGPNRAKVKGVEESSPDVGFASSRSLLAPHAIINTSSMVVNFIYLIFIVCQCREA